MEWKCVTIHVRQWLNFIPKVIMDPISKAIASDENRNLELSDDQSADASVEPADEAGQDEAVQGVRQTSSRVPSAPELVVPGMDRLVSWDETVEAGRRAESVLGEDESSLAEELVLEGADEAEFELRESTEDEEENEEV